MTHNIEKLLYKYKDYNTDIHKINNEQLDINRKYKDYHINKHNIIDSNTSNTISQDNIKLLIGDKPIKNLNDLNPKELDSLPLNERQLLDSKSFNRNSSRSGILGDRFIQNQETIIHIDSSERDITKYSTPSQYLYEFRKTFNNIVSVELISSEIPNTLKLIRDSPSTKQNNLIYWYNLDDGEGLLYQATITPGNYSTEDSLATAIQTAMNSVIRTATGENHNFTVTVDTDTDLVTFTQTDGELLSSGPFDIAQVNIDFLNTYGYDTDTVAAISVNYPGHGFSAGDTIIISGADNVGTVPAEYINGEHKVFGGSAPNSIGIIIEGLPVTPVIALNAGGDNVTISTYVSFSLLFNRSGTPRDILGFSAIDTDYDFVQYNTEEIFQSTTYYSAITGNYIPDPDTIINVEARMKIKNISAYTTAPYDDGSYTLITTIQDHGLSVSDEIAVWFTPSSATGPIDTSSYIEPDGNLLNDEDIAYDHLYGGGTALENQLTNPEYISVNEFLFFTQAFSNPIINIPTSDSFLIQVTYPVIPTIESYKINNNVISDENQWGSLLINFSGITEELYGTTAYTGTTIEDGTLIPDTDSELLTVDYRLKIKEIFDPDGYDSSIYSQIETLEPHGLTTGDKIFILSDENNAIISQDPVGTNPNYETDIVYDHLYGITEGALTDDDNSFRQVFVANLLISTGLTVTVIDDYNVLVPVGYVTITEIEDQKDVAGVISDENQWGSIIVRTSSPTINLINDSYIYMTIPNLETSIDTPNVQDIFAKIQMSGPSDSILFNTYVPQRKIFYNSPYPQLSNIFVSFKDKDGELIEFNEIEHSYTLRIVESLQKIEGNGISARTGTRT
jgi:hypothetical protein